MVTLLRLKTELRFWSFLKDGQEQMLDGRGWETSWTRQECWSPKEEWESCLKTSSALLCIILLSFWTFWKWEKYLLVDYVTNIALSVSLLVDTHFMPCLFLLQTLFMNFFCTSELVCRFLSSIEENERTLKPASILRTSLYLWQCQRTGRFLIQRVPRCCLYLHT